ncbi:Peptide-N4-(N-acetyl-beta-glucosaminyl) asparagine amidase A [Ancistrocladus abbreviatus]
MIISLLSVLMICFSLPSHHSATVIHHYRFTNLQSLATQSNADVPPTTDFEVTKPINVPKTQPCSYFILQHDFGFTYGKPPVLASYVPPSNCPSKEFSAIVLEWNATSKGVQFDRIFGVWLGGIELLRGCTAEPQANGIVWKVDKDITRYYSLLMSNQTLAVYLGNLVDSTYTGVYHVNITFHFYPAEEKQSFDAKLDKLGSGYDKYGGNLAKSLYGYDYYADLVMPISRNLPLNDGLWFKVENSTDVESKEFLIPQNVYRAVLEVYVSFHENDEFWYTNLPNEYIKANHLSGYPGNGPFREVVVSLDGEVVGAIWPFTVIYTGGINPLMWTPITGIGSFDLPTYDIEITPFLGRLLDGMTHKLEFSVTNALNVWFVDANLHLWLDKKREKTKGKLLTNQIKPAMPSSMLDFDGLNGTFLTKAKRSIVSTGWVESSYGRIITRTKQQLNYDNFMVIGNDGSLQVVSQTIDVDTSFSAEIPCSSTYTVKSYKKFPLYVYTNAVPQTDNSYTLVTNVNLEFDEEKVMDHGSGSATSYLNNVQNAQGTRVVESGFVIAGSGSTEEAYEYDSGRGFCYFRDVSCSNDAILYDKVSSKCNEKSGSQLSVRFGKLRQYVGRAVYGTVV